MLGRVTPSDPCEFRRTDAPPADACDETHTRDTAVAALAARQCGVVTTAQLASAGIGERAVAHRVASGWLTRLHSGVYRVGPIDAPYGREMAAILATLLVVRAARRGPGRPDGRVGPRPSAASQPQHVPACARQKNRVELPTEGRDERHHTAA